MMRHAAKTNIIEIRDIIVPDKGIGKRVDTKSPNVTKNSFSASMIIYTPPYNKHLVTKPPIIPIVTTPTTIYPKPVN